MDTEEQGNELLALQSIFSSEEFARHESKSSGELRVSVELPSGYAVTLAEDDALKQCKISFLPPLGLNFGLPEDYPSRSPPSFSLSCNWLTHNQLAALGAHLGDLYRATAGDVVLFSWVQFLREDTLAFLNLNSALVLPNVPSTPYNSQESIHAALPGPKSSPTALTSGAENVQTFFLDDEKRVKGAGDDAPETYVERGPFSGLSLSPTQSLLSEILTHDAARGQKVFQSTVYDCAVCFMSYLGSECVRIQECGHVFCQACLAEFCKLQIIEGNVLAVTCAEAGCAAFPTQAQVKHNCNCSLDSSLAVDILSVSCHL